MNPRRYDVGSSARERGIFAALELSQTEGLRIAILTRP